MFRMILATLAVACLIVASQCPPVTANEKMHGGSATLGPLKIEGAMARASIGRAPNSAAYLTVTTSGAPDRLIAVVSPAAAKAELHETSMKDGVMSMSPAEGGFAVTADAPAVLEPGGGHIMLMGLTGPLDDGTEVELTLTFETAGEVTLMVPVMKGIGHSH